MGKPRISLESINKIKFLRQKGWSLPEIKREMSLGYGTVYRYIRGVEILPEFKDIWEQKRSGSVSRMKRLQSIAANKAISMVPSVSLKEKAIFLSALYWGEGSKKDLNFMNSDPEMIRVFISGILEVFDINYDRIRISIRIFEDLDYNDCLNFWSNLTGVPSSEFLSVEVKPGKKSGKLPYGMCRVRVIKGSEILKTLKAIKDQSAYFFKMSP